MMGSAGPSPDPAPVPLLIAIDGPAASGKGTLARRLAAELGLRHLDTGLLYRAVGKKLLDAGRDPDEQRLAERAARDLRTEDLDEAGLRGDAVAEAASKVAAQPAVRAALLDFQRDFAHRPPGAVLDGRDIGTVVLPDAAVKLFVTADADVRAQRRWNELQGRGVNVIYPAVLEDLRRRDARDSQRKSAPLKPAADAVLIDTSRMDAEEAFHHALSLVRQARA